MSQILIEYIYIQKMPKKKYQFFIVKGEGTGLKHFNDPKAFIEFK